MGLFSSHITPDIVSEISIKFSKEKYIFGVDTHIEGVLYIPEKYTYPENEILLKYVLIDGVSKKPVTWDVLGNLDLMEGDHSYIEKLKISKKESPFSFKIKMANFYGNMGSPVDSKEFSYIINCIKVSIEDIDYYDRIPVSIEYLDQDTIILKNLYEKENIHEDDFDDLEEPIFDVMRGIKKLWDKKLISEEIYNNTDGLTLRQKLGKYLYESQVFKKIFLFGVLTFIPYYGWSFNFETLNIFMDAPKQAIDIVYTGFITICIYLQFFCVRAFQKYIEKKLWWMNMLYDSEEDLEENYHINYFQKDIISLRELVAENTKNPCFSLNISGTVKIGISIYHDFYISKNTSHQQLFIDKKFAEYRFSSLSSLLDHQVEVPKWVRDMVSIHDEDGNLYCDIIIFIQYDGLMNQYREINLY